MATTLAQCRIRKGQSQGQVVRRAYSYREYNVKFDDRETFYAEVPLGTLLADDATTTGNCTTALVSGQTHLISYESAFAANAVGETVTLTGVGDFTSIATDRTMKRLMVTGDATPTDYVAGVTASVPVYSGGKSTCVATTGIFTAGMVGWQLAFKPSGKGYTITDYVSTTTVKVSGDASGEYGGDMITTHSALAFSIPVAPLTARYIEKRDLIDYRPGQPGRSTIKLWYRTPRWYRPDDTQQVRGKVYIDRIMTRERLIEDTGDDGIQGDGSSASEADTRLRKHWKVVKGENYVLVPRTRYRLVAAAQSSWDPIVVDGLMGQINNARALGCATGLLLFTGCREQITVLYDDEPLRQVELSFLKNPNGWNSELKSRQYESKVVEAPVIVEATGVAAPRKARVIRDVAVAVAAARVPYVLGDFGLFNNMTEL